MAAGHLVPFILEVLDLKVAGVHADLLLNQEKWRHGARKADSPGVDVEGKGE